MATPPDDGPRALADALAWLRSHFDPAAAAGLDLRYAFVLGGPSGGALHLHVRGGQLEARASDGAADVVFRLEAEDFFAVLAGRANVDMLFMQDRIAVEGDLSHALKLRRLFRRGRYAA